MKIQFYFDPSCPWCWITSRWIEQVSYDREIDVDFRSFSLALKNKTIGNENANEYGSSMNRAHKLLRVVEKIRKEFGKEKVAEFYSRVGTKIHIENNGNIDWVSDVLRELELSSAEDALEDLSWDKILQQSLEEAIAVVGDDVGVPLFIVDDGNDKRGFFGPVISEMPSREEGLRLWDGIVGMVSINYFYELKRTRKIGPNTVSTAGLMKSEERSPVDPDITISSDSCPIS